jgi:cytochrome c oxidase cbb3-type subunit 3
MRFFRLLSLAMSLAAAGCDVSLPGKPNPANRPVPPAERKDFAGLFAQNCSGCHGADGKLGPAPPLNDAIFLAIVPDDELLQVVADGRPGTPMPAFSKQHSGTLTDEQIKIIAEGLKLHFKQEKPPQADLPAYALTVHGEAASPESLQRGAALFAKACATCHSGDEGAPGRLDNPALLTLFSDQALRRIIITGRPDLGMPSFADESGRDGSFKPLTAEDIDDLVALLAHWRKQPPQVANSSLTNVPSDLEKKVQTPSARHGY